MEDKKKNRKRKKIALTLSVCLLIIWGLLGTGASLAWFEDEDQVVNVFHTAEFGLEVYYETPDINDGWTQIEGETSIFDDKALYEPGYVQVVYLKVENTGTVPFDFNIAVGGTSCEDKAVNVYGQTIYLKDYLQFGVVVEDNDDENLENFKKKIETRDLAKEYATMPLNRYYFKAATNGDSENPYSLENDNYLGAGEEKHIALIVYMPESVGNEANYRGDTIPQVELGIVVSATQQKNN